MSSLDIVRQNLLSPIALCFALGFLATFVRSDLRMPAGAYVGLSSYLLLAIGLKGGVALSETPLSELSVPLVATLILGSIVPVVVYNVGRRFGKLDRVNASALAAHYGSVSAVTFIASLTFLDSQNIPHEGYMAALVTVMEIPGIIVALCIPQIRENANAQVATPIDAVDPGPAARTGLMAAIHDVITGKSIILLGGGLLIGALTGKGGYESVKPFFVAPFAGVLCLFMLEMGQLAAGRLRDIKSSGRFVVAWGILGPILLGFIGASVGKMIGMTTGGATILATLTASASYIAAPAAVRVALPTANPSLYLTPAVGITFPFNLAFGIPLYYEFAKLL